MEFLKAVTDRIPDHAKDVRLNIGSVLSRSSLEPEAALGVALAAAYAAKCKPIVDAIRSSGGMSEAETTGALSAAALMGMNNVYYRFRHIIGKDSYSEKPARLRMMRLKQAATNQPDLELFCLAVSAVNNCEACTRSHEAVVLEGGLTEDHVHDAVRIAATINAAAVALSMG